METTWFYLIAVMLAVYVTLDGFDLGAGAVHFLVARTESERRLVYRSIGPVWDGNEVWLLAAGGTLYFAFPVLYASSFSGFYLPLMVVLWLLILRGISIEFRNHVASLVWHPFWDAVFAGSSALLAVFFGAALGNVVRGVPLDSHGDFFLPLWTNFAPGSDPGILDWYTVLIAVAALLSLAMHGALWIAYKTEGALRDRARALAGGVWWAVGASVVAITIASFGVQPHLRENFSRYPAIYVVPLATLAALAGARWLRRSRSRFLASCAFLIGMLSSAALSLYPYVLPSNSDPGLSLTIYNSATGAYGLRIGLFWFVPGMALAVGYFVYTYRSFAGKLKLEDEGY